MKNLQFFILLIVNIIGFVVLCSYFNNRFNDLETQIGISQEKSNKSLIKIGGE